MATGDAFPFRPLPPPFRYAIGLAAVGLVYVVSYSFDAVIDDGSQFLLLGTAVMASAWFVGTGPALAATVAAALFGAWDAATANVEPRAAQTHLALFVVQGLLLTALVTELRAARRIAEDRARLAQDARHESEAANRMKDEFLATISHELRTPLNAVLGWVNLLKTTKLDPATSMRGLESIDRNVRLQAQLTTDLLDVSKALTGKLRLEARSVSVLEAAQEATAALVSAARAKGVVVKTQLPAEAVSVLGDSTRLRQIVWHLMANGIKFTPRGGTVEIQVRTTREHVILTISDSGPGIAPRFLPHIFDRFTQEDPSPTRSAGGLGVGLSLVRELVELHGGEIHARNREDQPGAVFTVTFPLQPGDALRPAKLPPAVAATGPGIPPLEGLRVLVVDQDVEGRELVRTVLQQRGATVRTAENVADALEALEAWRPDALITDSASPEHDTYALIGKVQWLEADRGGRIPAAALTAYARTDERVRQMLEAVHSELPKPIEPAQLAAEIARLTGRERRRVERIN